MTKCRHHGVVCRPAVKAHLARHRPDRCLIDPANTARRLQPQSPAVQDYEQPNPRNVGLDDDRLGSNASESPDVSSLTNPLSTGPSTFMLSDTGRTGKLAVAMRAN